MEVLSIGRSATGPEECAMEICGSQLLVRITFARRVGLDERLQAR